MIPPLVSFITWNRLGLTARNLSALLGTQEDFELHIADNRSLDDTWEYLQDIRDPRIKSIIRFDVNSGPVYAVNFNLSKRRKDQYFITVDNDVNIHTPNWITKFMNVFEAFPEVGLLGAVTGEYYERYRQPLIRRQKGEAGYLELCKGFVEGCCQCLCPALIEQLGYWSEENCMGDVELCYRIQNHTSFKAGFIPAVEIDQVQKIPCESCEAGPWCRLRFTGKDCFTVRDEKYRNPQFRNFYGWKYRQCIRQMEEGKRNAACASIHDEASQKKYYYNRPMAEENFRYYITNAN